ncbi:MAG: GNAT family N-acetyltransferase [Proteobacteria bacterium]|nr:GNAT family N-acetyltransferase [Pseudomonadota bacterium]
MKVSGAARLAPVSLSIRRAGKEDAQALSRIACRTFTETFGPMYPAEDLDDFLRTNYAVAECERLLSDPRYAAWLVECDGQAVGHALAGPCGLPHADVQTGDGELKRLYLLASAQNGGCGARLFRDVLAWLEADGPRRIWISVWSGNLGAQRFYERFGFAKVAEYEFPVGRQRDREFMFRRDARPLATS